MNQVWMGLAVLKPWCTSVGPLKVYKYPSNQASTVEILIPLVCGMNIFKKFTGVLIQTKTL